LASVRAEEGDLAPADQTNESAGLDNASEQVEAEVVLPPEEEDRSLTGAAPNTAAAPELQRAPAPDPVLAEIFTIRNKLKQTNEEQKLNARLDVLHTKFTFVPLDTTKLA